MRDHSLSDGDPEGACDFCGKEESTPFQCRYCGGQFCTDHCLPPNHRCIHEDDWWFDELPAGPAPGGPDTALLERTCSFCGTGTHRLFFCPACGKEFCEIHRLPVEHRCPPQHPEPGLTLNTANVPRTPRSGFPIQRIPLIVTIVLVIVTILIAGFAGHFLISKLVHHADLPAQPGGPFGQDGMPASPRPAETAIPASTTPAPTPFPLKIPATIRITPTPTPVPGVLSFPRIVEDSSRGTIARNYSFPFQDRTVSIAASVNKSVYNGAKYGKKTIVTDRKNINRLVWAPAYFLAFINDYHQERFYADLLDGFRNARRMYNLSDDEYLELITVFVQSLPYDTSSSEDPDSDNRFPVETFVDGKGVCGDKSLLLAGLLSRERYDVVLFLFDAEKHMAVGVRSSTYGYRNTSYAFIETTRLSFVGVVPDRLAGDIVLKSMPSVIPVGNGGRGYLHANETVYIRRQQESLEERVKSLETMIRTSGPDRSGYSQLIDEHNRYVLVYNYVSTHIYDRAGTYEYIL